MLVNCHAHLFTAYTVATPTTVRIAARRVGAKAGPIMERAVEGLLNGLVKKPELLSERDLLRALVRGLVEQDAFKQWLDGLGADLPVDLRGLLAAAPPLGEQQLARVLSAITRVMEKEGGKAAGVADVIETIRLALKPDSTEIARLLLEQIPPDAGLVALMMDISGGVDGDDDLRKFKQQINELGAAALAYPGRILPFIAVNTNRKQHLALLKDCVLNRGFVGVKLYPSLGYSVESDAMRAVLSFCAENDVPVTMHCGQGGFYRSGADIDFCNPSHWPTLLDEFPTLRVCFAHCGGGELFCEPVKPDGWDALVVGLLERYDNVYADLSYHADQMRDPAKEAKWLERITALIDHDEYGERILFGTDSWLVRANVTEEAYWQWFREKLGDARWRRIAEVAPRKFLGLPDGNGQGAGANIARHIAWLQNKQKRLGRTPSPWVVRAGGPQAKGTEAVDPSWDITNPAHFTTWAYFYHSEMSADQRKKRDFPHAAAFRTAECHFYTKGVEPDDMFDEQCNATARRLVALCKAQRAQLAGEWTDDTAVPHLAGLLADGDTTLQDVGAEVGKVLEFPEAT